MEGGTVPGWKRYMYFLFRGRVVGRRFALGEPTVRVLFWSVYDSGDRVRYLTDFKK